MKGTIIITTLIIAMCLTMAFPASAAIVFYDRKSMIDGIEQFKTDLQNGTALLDAHSTYMTGNWKETYKYVLFYANSRSDKNVTSIRALVSDSPTIKFGSRVLDYTISESKYSPSQLAYVTYSDVGLIGGEFPRISTSSLRNICYYLYEYSTAKIDGFDTDFIASDGRNWFVKFYPGADTTKLENAITSAEQLEYDNYRLDTWNALQTAISNAKDFIASADFTKDDVVNETAKLQTAIDSLEKLPDSSELRSAIDYASRAVNTGYEEQIWKRFENSLSAARSLLNGMMYTEQELKTHLIDLRKSMNTLISLPYTTDNLNMLPNSFMLTIPIILTTAIALYALVRWLNIIPWLMRLFVH